MTPSFTTKAVVGTVAGAIVVAVLFHGNDADRARQARGTPPPLEASIEREAKVITPVEVEDRGGNDPHAAEAVDEPIASAPGATLVPGHFDGVSVRHDPDAAAKAAAASPPGSEEVITTASGKKLLRVATDERHDIPLAPPPAK